MNYAQQTASQLSNGAQLSAVKSSPTDEALSAVHGSLASLESEISNLHCALEPVTIQMPAAPGNTGAVNSVSQPAGCRIENTLREFDSRLATAWQLLSALRASLRI